MYNPKDDYKASYPLMNFQSAKLNASLPYLDLWWWVEGKCDPSVGCCFVAINLGKGARLKLLRTICLPRDERFCMWFYFITKNVESLYMVSFSKLLWYIGVLVWYLDISFWVACSLVYVCSLKFYTTLAQGEAIWAGSDYRHGFYTSFNIRYIVYPSKGALSWAHVYWIID
jgi:hypothetical protein